MTTTPAVERAVSVRLVNAPVEGVVAPMAVLLIPVAVVLKLLAVIVNAFVPVLMLDADSPERESAPDVALRLRLPVVKVNPLEAVRSPALVTVPEPIVVMLPEVDKLPFSSIVNVLTPPDWMAREVLVATFVSLIMNAVAVPALVSVSWRVLPAASVKAILPYASVALIVLPD